MSQKLRVIGRIFVEADQREAEEVASRLEQHLANVLGPAKIESYWKEPTWKEITFEIAAQLTKPEDALKAISAKLGDGWTFGSEDATAFAIWNPDEAHSFVEEGVRFANLEVVSD